MSIVDLSIIVIYLLLIFSFGIFMRSNVSDFSNFMIANQKLPLSLGVTSMLGTELGLITVMYNAQTGALQYFSAFHIGLFGFIVTLMVGLSGFVVTRLRDMNIKSIPEFYSQRFGQRTRILGAFLLVVGGMLNMGIFLNVGAKFIQAIFGFDTSDQSLKVIMILLLFIVLIYTMMGGMLSVIVTDYFQFIILSIGLLFCVFYSISTLGWNNIFESVEKMSLNNPYNPFISKGYSYVFWQMVLAFVSAVVWPTAITRALTMDSSKTVKKQYVWSSISFLIRFMIPCFIGICATVYYADKGIINIDKLMLMPSFLSEILPVGLLGLVVAGMLSAFMSTHDSYLLCWSTIITNDIIEPLSGKKLSSKLKINISRVIIFLLGIYILYWGLFYKGNDSVWSYLGITGAIYFSGAITVLIAGLYWKNASEVGANLALLGGLSALIGLEPIRRMLSINLQPEQIGLISLLFAFSMMIFGSILFPNNNKDILS
jgi:SSS family solute:Na+ symporter